MKNIALFFSKLLHNAKPPARASDAYNYRRLNLMTQIDFVLDTLEMMKLDIVYMENLKMPMTQDEKIYFTSQVQRLDGAISILLWLRGNVQENTSLWSKLLVWRKV